jgi:hypothetical protein
MQQPTWLMAMVALFLAATLTWADLGYAQAQRGPRREGATQGAGPGRGSGNPNCPNYSGSQTCPSYGTCNNQARTRQRTRGGATQAPAPSNPQSQTPSAPSGK